MVQKAHVSLPALLHPGIYFKKNTNGSPVLPIQIHSELVWNCVFTMLSCLLAYITSEVLWWLLDTREFGFPAPPGEVDRHASPSHPTDPKGQHHSQYHLSSLWKSGAISPRFCKSSTASKFTLRLISSRYRTTLCFLAVVLQTDGTFPDPSQEVPSKCSLENVRDTHLLTWVRLWGDHLQVIC